MKQCIPDLARSSLFQRPNLFDYILRICTYYQSGEGVTREFYKKRENFSCHASLNREDFMSLLSKIWNEWAKPESIQRTGKKVEISDKGLDVQWMGQSKFERAEAILNPPATSQKAGSSHSSFDSPPNVRKGTAEYYKFKFEQAQENIKQLEQTPLDPSEVPSVFH